MFEFFLLHFWVELFVRACACAHKYTTMRAQASACVCMFNPENLDFIVLLFLYFFVSLNAYFRFCLS